MTPAERDDLLARLDRLIQSRLEKWAAGRVFGPQLLYTRPQAAALLGISESSITVAILRGWLKPRRFGRLRLIPHDQLVALSRRDVSEFWPEKIDGKTTRVAVAHRRAG